MANIVDIEGIGPQYAEKLKTIGITTVEGLLDAGGAPKGRADIAAKTGIADKLILTWVNHADLFRIKGIGSQYADLLEAAGVDTVVELGKRNAENLHAALTKANEEKKLVRALPALASVTDWVNQAKALPRKVEY